MLGARNIGGAGRVAQDQVDLGIPILAVEIRHRKIDLAFVCVAPLGIGTRKRRDDADRRVIFGAAWLNHDGRPEDGGGKAGEQIAHDASLLKISLGASAGGYFRYAREIVPAPVLEFF